ncbi:hypothetical protein D4764_10G0006230 [Takifugu flavidus]|uniref:Uncharacterized protein n=1 Tax=Takifugu flavidus TaxID=433684 RepID=A0A5C6PJH4_9TELE|nr:hypothetical protein D4764_10G0006230 [Takifugu flavidus]
MSINLNPCDIQFGCHILLSPLCTRRDVDSLSRWQCDFREQIRALRQWLKSMEMSLPPVDPRLDFRKQHKGRESAILDS